MRSGLLCWLGSEVLLACRPLDGPPPSGALSYVPQTALRSNTYWGCRMGLLVHGVRCMALPTGTQPGLRPNIPGRQRFIRQVSELNTAD